MESLSQSGVPIKDIESLIHGTTCVINAITENMGDHGTAKKGLATTGLITSAGFRDILEIARGSRVQFFTPNFTKSKPWIPRRLREEVPGHFNYQGVEVTKFDPSCLPRIV
jgi:N-methylhydantoinase A